MMLSVEDLEKVSHKEFRYRDRVRKISGISSDTRTLKKGNLFFAIRGENFDGHKFVAGAFEKGACAAVVETGSEVPRDHAAPLLIVEDTTRALGELANLYRRKFSLPIIAIGGSNGKTTTKDMIAQVLRGPYNVLATEANHNNHIGVPLTLFRLEKRHTVAVVEIGTNHPGEIEYLSRILEPTDGLITNIGLEHLEFFKTLDGVASEEGILFRSLKKGRAFVNADDKSVQAIGRRRKNRYTYGFEKQTDVAGTIIDEDGRGCVRFEFRGKKMKRSSGIQLRVPGRHNAANALAAAAVGLAYNIPPTRIRKALESFRATSKRMEIVRIKGVTIYNDTYNANPESTIEALRTLALARVKGKKIAVLGDMLELGEQGPEQHSRVGREVSRLGIDCLLTFGDLARNIHDPAGIPMAIHYDQKNVLAEYLAELVGPGDAILVKGSRGMKMEDIVTFLSERIGHANQPVGD